MGEAIPDTSAHEALVSLLLAVVEAAESGAEALGALASCACTSRALHAAARDDEPWKLLAQRMWPAAAEARLPRGYTWRVYVRTRSRAERRFLAREDALAAGEVGPGRCTFFLDVLDSATGELVTCTTLKEPSWMVFFHDWDSPLRDALPVPVEDWPEARVRVMALRHADGAVAALIDGIAQSHRMPEHTLQEDDEAVFVAGPAYPTYGDQATRFVLVAAGDRACLEVQVHTRRGRWRQPTRTEEEEEMLWPETLDELIWVPPRPPGSPAFFVRPGGGAPGARDDDDATTLLQRLPREVLARVMVRVADDDPHAAAAAALTCTALAACARAPLQAACRAALLRTRAPGLARHFAALQQQPQPRADGFSCCGLANQVCLVLRGFNERPPPESSLNDIQFFLDFSVAACTNELHDADAQTGPGGDGEEVLHSPPAPPRRVLVYSGATEVAPAEPDLFHPRGGVFKGRSILNYAEIFVSESDRAFGAAEQLPAHLPRPRPPFSPPDAARAWMTWPGNLHATLSALRVRDGAVAYLGVRRDVRSWSTIRDCISFYEDDERLRDIAFIDMAVYFSPGLRGNGARGCCDETVECEVSVMWHRRSWARQSTTTAAEDADMPLASHFENGRLEFALKGAFGEQAPPPCTRCGAAHGMQAADLLNLLAGADWQLP